MARRIEVESPWIGTTVRVTKPKGSRPVVGRIVKVDRRDPDLYDDGLTYYIEVTHNFRVLCKWAEFEPVPVVEDTR